MTAQGTNAPALTAHAPQQLFAMTTTIVKGKNLLADGYTVKEAGDGHGFYIVHGPDEVSRTGKVTHHGPYRVDVLTPTCSCPGFQFMNGVCKHVEAALAAFSGVAYSPFCEVLEDRLYALVSLSDDKTRLLTTNSLIYVFRSSDLAGYQAKAAEKTFGKLQAVPLTMEAIKGAMGDGRYCGVRLSMQGDFADIAFPGRHGDGAAPKFATAPNVGLSGRAGTSDEVPANAWGSWREDVAAKVPALVGVGNGKAPEVRSYEFPARPERPRPTQAELAERMKVEF